MRHHDAPYESPLSDPKAKLKNSLLRHGQAALHGHPAAETHQLWPLTDLLDEEAGLAIANADDVGEVTNYLRAFRLVRDNLRSDTGLPLSVRPLCEGHRLLLDGARGASKQPGELRRSQSYLTPIA